MSCCPKTFSIALFKTWEGACMGTAYKDILLKLCFVGITLSTYEDLNMRNYCQTCQAWIQLQRTRDLKETGFQSSRTQMKQGPQSPGGGFVVLPLSLLLQRIKWQWGGVFSSSVVKNKITSPLGDSEMLFIHLLSQQAFLSYFTSGQRPLSSLVFSASAFVNRPEMALPLFYPRQK